MKEYKLVQVNDHLYGNTVQVGSSTYFGCSYNTKTQTYTAYWSCVYTIDKERTFKKLSTVNKYAAEYGIKFVE